MCDKYTETPERLLNSASSLKPEKLRVKRTGSGDKALELRPVGLEYGSTQNVF